MFRISFFVEDKALAGVLHRLDGFGPKDLEVVPVANLAAKKNGELKVTARGTVDGFIQALRASGAKIDAQSARAAAAVCGGSATSYAYFLKKAIAQGAIKKKGQGTRSIYEWRA